MKPPSNVKTPAQYIASLPADRAKTIATVRALVNKHIPRGYDECLVWGTIGWTIPLSRYPDTYNKQPICYVALSSQKNYCSLYLMGAFWSASQLEQLKAAFKAAGKKLDMGKCCVHFESPDDLPLEAIGKLISAISSEKWIEMYEQSRLLTKAGQAQKAKQGAPSAQQGGRQARRHKASAVNFSSMTRRYLATTTFSIAVAGALAIAACSSERQGDARRRTVPTSPSVASTCCVSRIPFQAITSATATRPRSTNRMPVSADRASTRDRSELLKRALKNSTGLV